MSNDSMVTKPQRAVDAQNAGAHPRDSGPYGGIPTHATPRIMTTGNATPGPPNVMTPKIATQLARKRARDRRAQQAMRDRTKGEIETLKEQVAYLSQLLSARESPTSPSTSISRSHLNEIEQLRQENEQLQHELILARNLIRADGPDPPLSTEVPGHVGLIIEPTILELWSSHLSRASESPSVPAPEAKSILRSHRKSFVLSNHHDVPWHVAPTCPADRIMQPFCEEKRRLVQSSTSSSSSPNLSKDSAHADIQTAISRVAADVLATYSEIDTLPKKVACLYLISSVLNWYIYQTRFVFEQMPPWMRPCPSQMEIPHPAWMDRVQWPRVRDYLVRHQDITFDEYTDAFSLSFDVNWPYDDALVVIKEDAPNSAVARWRINPIFEEHIRNMRNWTVGPRYWQFYPPLGKAVDEDREQFGA